MPPLKAGRCDHHRKASDLTLLFNPHDLDVSPAMPKAVPGRAVAQLLIEARKADAFDKPLAAALMLSLSRVLPRARALHGTIANWPGDLASDGVIFRLNAGLHALALAGKAPQLLGLYRTGNGPQIPPSIGLDRAVLAALVDHGEELLAWLAHPTQTNEVARVAGLVAALLELGRAQPMACDVLELGASAGLNLNFPYYSCRLADREAGAADSPVMLAPRWRGRAAAGGALTVTGARGVDLHPLDVARPDHRSRLEAYVWPGEYGRNARLDAAIGLALRFPPQVERGQAGEWLARELAEPQAPGVRRVVFHSMALQYADARERAAIDAALAAAGARAGRDTPIARVGIEWCRDRRSVELRVTQWDGGRQTGAPVVAALCHPYGEWLEWRGFD